jgi:hypothetical protein
MSSISDNPGIGAVDKKSRRPLPDVDASGEGVGGPEGLAFSAESAEPSSSRKFFGLPLVFLRNLRRPASAVKVDPAAISLETQLVQANRRGQIGLGVGTVALALTLSAPWWQPYVFDNDLASRQASVLAAAQLKALSVHSEPFAAKLSLLAHALPRDKATVQLIEQITPLAEAGVPTADVLRLRFAGTADQVLIGKVVDKNDESWLNWSVHKVAALVRFDTLVEAVVAPPADVIVVHDAEAAIKDKDLPRAVEYLSKLDGSSGRVVRSWLADARDRVTLDAAIATLSDQAEKRANEPASVRLVQTVTGWVNGEDGNN